MAKYSVVVPTKSRADTLQHVLRNVLSSPRRDIEVVVHQCGADAATDAVVAAVGDPRVRYFRTKESLPMRENWERAVGESRGEFVTVIGDDDGIVPGAFELADALIAAHAPRLLTWRPVTYYWPTYFNPALAGRAIYRYDIASGNIRYSSAYALRWLYRFKWHYSDMPMIYNSFARRDLIDSVRAARGRYFFLNSPDVTSGVVNASHSEDFLWSNYPLSITGISKNSTGHRLVMQDDSRVKEGAMKEFMPARVEQPWIAPGANLDFGIAAELLALREELGLEARGVTSSMQGVAEYVARQLNQYPGQIGESRASLRAFCDRHGIDFDEIATRFLLEAAPSRGPGGEAESESQVVMDRDLAQSGDGDIHAAAQSIAACLGIPRPASVSRVGFAGEDGGSRDRAVLTFCHTGNAVQRLGDGWNRPEAFGAWACDYRASVRIPVPTGASAEARVRIEIALRGPVIDAQSRFFYAVHVPRARAGLSREFSGERLSGTDILEIDVAALGGDREVEVVFRCVDLVNTAVLGLGEDNRPLGTGLERITVSTLPPRREGEA